MPHPIKALSLHQPWATLIAVGAKRIETRSWKPPCNILGERLAIHATKQVIRFPNTDEYRPFNEAAARHLGPGWEVRVPKGAVVAIATLDSAKPFLACYEDQLEVEEALFGEYGPGRWMWRLKDVEPLDPPMPARGRQRIWSWQPVRE